MVGKEPSSGIILSGLSESLLSAFQYCHLGDFMNIHVRKMPNVQI